VVAFIQRIVNPLFPVAGYYLGKTSDLVFKPEADKSLDLDDGTTEVGSEKLNLSFSILGKLLNNWDIKEVWLIPICDDYELRNPEILRIYLVEGDYRLEAKSGEFGKINFSSSLRYPVAAPQYAFLANYFQTSFILLGSLTGNFAGEELTLYDVNGYDVALLIADDQIVEGCLAFVGLPNHTEYSLLGINFANDYDANDTVGVLKVSIPVN